MRTTQRSAGRDRPLSMFISIYAAQMVMGRRPEVETAGIVSTSRAMAGLGAHLGIALTEAALDRPWQGSASPGRNVAQNFMRHSVKSLMTYSMGLPTPELRSVEIVIDDLAGVAMPPPWRRGEVSIETSSAGGVRGQKIRPVDGPVRGHILYLHGGGYLATTPKMYAAIASQIAITSNCELFLPDYRLAPEFPYPAGLDDARSAYEDLIGSSGADRVIVAGDSGGGGLTAALLEDQRDNHGVMPAGAIMMSPEVDLTLRGTSIRQNAADDILPDRIPVDPYLQGVDPTDPEVSPLFGDFGGYPPLLVTAGSQEMFRDEIRQFVDRARQADVAVTYFEAPDMVHVFEIVSPWSNASHLALADLARFVDSQLPTEPISAE